MQLFTFGGVAIKQEGICWRGVRFWDRFVGMTFYVVNSKGPILFGLQTSREFGLIILNLAIKTDPPATREHKALTDSEENVKIRHCVKPIPILRSSQKRVSKVSDLSRG